MCAEQCSRGYSIKLELEESCEAHSQYSVNASGWDQPTPDRTVGRVVINHDTDTVEFVALNEWSGESFFIPPIQELIHPSKTLDIGVLNKSYGWWHARLLTAIHRILTQAEYSEKSLVLPVMTHNKSFKADAVNGAA